MTNIDEWVQAWSSDRTVRPMLRLTLMYFARAFERGEGGVSVRQLAYYLDAQVTSARRQVQAARELGWLERTAFGQQGEPARYVPTIPAR